MAKCPTVSFIRPSAVDEEVDGCRNKVHIRTEEEVWQLIGHVAFHGQFQSAEFI